jgi:hypothetical protein
MSSTGTIHLPSLGFTNAYWDAGPVGSNPPKWIYLDLACTLPKGGAITGYTVHEQGADSGYRIYPSTSCSVDPSNTILWQYLDEAPVPTGQQGGYIRGQSSGSAAKFAMDCPVLNNTKVNFAVSWGSLFVTGCNLNNSNLSTMTWRAVPPPGRTQWPSEVLPVDPGDPTVPFMTIPITGTNHLVCGVNGPTGDGKLLSYRMGKQPDRSSWIVSSSTGGTPTGTVTINDARNAKDNGSRSESSAL